jgi:hypothetical protein
MDELPTLTPNCVLIRYEDLLTDLKTTLQVIENAGLTRRPNIEFPLNTDQYKMLAKVSYKAHTKKLRHHIKACQVWNNANFVPEYEKRLGYKSV